MTYLDILVVVVSRLGGIKVKTTHAWTVDVVLQLSHSFASKIASKVGLDSDKKF